MAVPKGDYSLFVDLADPDNWVLKASPDLQVRISILKGQQLAAQGDLSGALTEYQNALKSNSQSSLASYRIGEVYFTQRSFQASVNAYREALREGRPHAGLGESQCIRSHRRALSAGAGRAASGRAAWFAGNCRPAGTIGRVGRFSPEG